MGFRFSLLITIFIGAYAYLLFHLYELQLRNGQSYFAQAESQDGAASLTQARRGAIYFTDRTGAIIPAAINKDFSRVYAVPKSIEDPKSAALALAGVFETPVASLESIFSKRTNYVLLEKKAPEEMVSKVNGLKQKGIYVAQFPERFYPFGQLASQLLGFVGPNNNDNGSSGRYGLEKFYENILAGKSGDKGASGDPGKDIVLTIDANIQKEAERILSDLVTKHNAKGGSVIVEDPKTGKILALGNYPNFDPNNYATSDLSRFENPSVEEIYEPGSVMKVITMSAGIDANKITPDTTYMDTGKLVIYDHTIMNWDHKAYGKMTMTNVIENSLNTGAAFAEKQTGNDIFVNYLQKFGFGDKTGIDIPGEVAGNIKNLTKGAPPVLFATASFGQGIAVTPLEVINAFAAIANGGTLMRPYVNADSSPQSIRRVISPDTASKVTAMMVSAVDKAKVAHINGYSIAAKTGTAQVPGKGGYSDRVIDSYAGFGPTKDPRFVILFKLAEPDGAPLAGATVVPAFHALAEFILNYYNVPPDRMTGK